ncbi:acyl-CoA N-acyltransferase [Rhizoclosmatium globosum]|uniref:histone acetyltransferase n=1 Tax=Rhizoclosmatium globosum TaxID=329046 RepID=A0A1Y2CX40_9FUNG|nr:acyl-CoA N-acyltransferase [Rhizoclosmatium globosum]|eukprot:ORY51599.1 acyl-CoA N-acyltransferase [Rhizoclosmatium globosum]
MQSTESLPPPLPLPPALNLSLPLPPPPPPSIDTSAQQTAQPPPPSPKKKKTAADEEREGKIIFRTVAPDGSDESMILLTGLKNIYQKQLPNMPKEYIARLVFDRNHLAMALIKPPLKVVAGITYRAFLDRRFAEIVFCAVSSTEQVRGYGALLMNHVKDYVISALGVQYFLTYADNFAIGYFKKQGFTTDITLDKSVWVGYIKDYEGGTLMQWTVIPKVVYLRASDIIEAQRKAVRDKIRATAEQEPRTHSGERAFGDQVSIPAENIPGMAEIGWTQDMLRRLGENKAAKMHGPLYGPLKIVVEEMRQNANAWPFVEPVSGVADYYDIIKEPMDISTLGALVENDEYQTVDHFVKDASKIFHNCKIYNEEGTNYVKCAIKLEKWFKERIKTLKADLLYAF